MLAPAYTIKGIWAAICAAVFLIVVIFAVVQTVRLEGFKLWPFKVEGALAKVDRLEDEIRAILQAQKEAEGAQQAVNDAAKAIYEDVAERIDNDAEAQEAAELDAVERFINARRVRCPATGGEARQANSAARGDSPGDGQTSSVSSELDDAVAVPASDVRVCTINTLQAEAARDWALQLEAASKGQ